MTRARESAYREKLGEILRTAYAILKEGATSLDAVVTAVQGMEDSGMFNAGKGAVYTADNTHELDAAVMNGATLDAGAVAAVRRVKNPIALARLVMEESRHVMLVGEGAERFAVEQGLELVENSYFDTPERLAQFQAAKAAERKRQRNLSETPAHRHGTVGAVALDRNGHVAAATSTGGMTNKKAGRVGDSPIIGAGVWADDHTCAVSATGHGEYLMRLVIAHEISSMMRHGKTSLRLAARAAIRRLNALGGTGGFVAMDRHGNIELPFNTEGMYRGRIGPNGKLFVGIHRP
jgi:beta-aspartyl-peptidase (threonine type)